MTFYIITLLDDPFIPGALSNCGVPILFSTKEIADKAILDLILPKKRDKYCVIPVSVKEVINDKV